MSYPHTSFFANEVDDTAQLARDLAQAVSSQLPTDAVIYLNGDLGAGKTTFSRYFIQSLGHSGSVKSPTYTLVEPYPIDNDRTCYHFDLYRLANPEELEFIGARDYFNETDVCLVEWPEKAEDYLPAADWICEFSHHESGRNLTITAASDKGNKLMLQVFSDF